LLVIVGTRPQIIKTAPLIKVAEADPAVEIAVLHTGQHYDRVLASNFFDEFGLPEPTFRFNIGSGDALHHVSSIALNLKRAPFLKGGWDIALVPGDTNSALGGALGARLSKIPVAHLEAGARCSNTAMVEEIKTRDIFERINTMMLMFGIIEGLTYEIETFSDGVDAMKYVLIPIASDDRYA